MSIHFEPQDGFAEYQPVTSNEIDGICRSLHECPLTTLYGGGDVEAFERRFAEMFGVGEAVAMNSGTSALHASLIALGIGSGDEVITPAYSFVASASVICQCGATPVFADVEPATLNIDVEYCRRLITHRTKALIAVHVFGNPADLAALRQLCDDAKIFLIEDCAGAAGARIGARYVGSVGDLGCFSFNIHKVIRTGEGGMVVTRNAQLAQILRELRVNGLNPHTGINNVVRLGFNYTLPQPIAALGREQLNMLYDMLERRARNKAILVESCVDLPVTSLPEPVGTTPVGWWTPLIVAKDLAPARELIIQRLRLLGIPAHGGYGMPLYKIPYLAPFAAGRAYPVIEDLAPRIFTIDPSPWFSESQMQAIVRALRDVIGQL